MTAGKIARALIDESGVFPHLDIIPPRLSILTYIT
jgi:hypothetical protein